MNTRLFVIGGGLAGISQAIKHQNEYSEIIIIEGGKSLGGLLKSVCINGNHYPIGTHFLRKTPKKNINDLLFSDQDDWNILPYLKNGNISYGTLSTSTGFMDIGKASLGTKVDFYAQLVKGLINRSNDNNNEAKGLNEYQDLKNRFGKRVAEDFNQLSYKYFGLDLREQAQGSLSPLVCTDRVKAFTDGITRYLKKWRYFDDRLSFHNSMIGSIKNSNFVPNKLNYTKWWCNVESRLSEYGFKVLKNTKVKSRNKMSLTIEEYNSMKMIKEIKLNQYDHTIDTVRVAKGSKVKKSQTVILFFECSHKPLIDSYYVTSYTSADPFSRITLCRNVGGDHNGIVTEIISPIDDNFNKIKMEKATESALKHYGIIDRYASINLVKVINLGSSGFQPKPYSKDSGSKELGIAGGNNWFMDEILNA
tara:strand:- start:15573 stop:16832 length:1260 start_codon:yes stop_codon:yes gene_type:complete